MPTLLIKDFRLLPQLKKNLVKVLWAEAKGVGLFTQSVGLFCQRINIGRKMGE